MKIDFLGEQDNLPKSIFTTIQSIFSKVKQLQNLPEDVEVTVSFVSDEEIRSLNDKYRGKKIPTDVLSFPLFSENELQYLPKEHPVALGDIVISVETARRQAKQYNHSELREFSFLAVHGLLHLLGYHHDTEEGEEEMFKLQNKLLKEYGLER